MADSHLMHVRKVNIISNTTKIALAFSRLSRNSSAPAQSSKEMANVPKVNVDSFLDVTYGEVFARARL